MTSSLLGSLCLALAAVVSTGGILAAISAVRFGSARALQVSRWALYLLTALLTGASAVLLIAILKDDFSLKYVVGYSERALPVAYKVAAFWAGHDGSLLLWAWLTAAMASLAVLFRRKDPLTTQTSAIALLIGLCGFFALLMLFSANPFAAFGAGEMIPEDGGGMNPMLQNPAMVAHPPLLFMGYAGFAIPFAFVLAALIAGREDNAWIAPVRNWTIAAWVFLTAGIVLGAWWAYVELGWGGYWAWDPVENASLLPWFTGTALIHSLIVQQRRGMLKTWVGILAPLSFILCIFGTYLTRSGVVQSVHAFPDSAVAKFFLTLLALLTVVTVVVLVLRRGLLKRATRLERAISPGGFFIVGNILLMLMMLATLIGTIYPVLSKPFTKHPITLGQEYYNTVVIPIAMALFILMAAAPVVARAKTFGELTKKMIIPVAATHVAIILAAIWCGRNGIWDGRHVWTVLSAGTATMIVVGVVQDAILTFKRMGPASSVAWRRCGGQFVHLGMAMVLVGVAGSSLYNSEQNLSLAPGESAQVAGYTLEFEELVEVEEANFNAVEAQMDLVATNGDRTALRPQLRVFRNRGQSNREVAVHTNLRQDIYVILGGVTSGGAGAVLTVAVFPLVIWIWIGGTVMSLGALVCLLIPARGRGALAGESTESAFQPVWPGGTR